MEFTGLANFREMQAAARLGGFLLLDETSSTSTRLDLSVWRKQGGSVEFSYLTGNRADAGLTQEVTAGIFTFDAGYAFRLDAIGSTTFGAARCGSPGCEALEAFGYSSHTFWVSAKAQPLQRFSLDLTTGVELRSYLSNDGIFDRGGREVAMDRQDQLVFGSLSASLRVTTGFAVNARYELVDNASNVGSGGNGIQGRGYFKQVASFGTLFGW
jgi:hypothetical protein